MLITSNILLLLAHAGATAAHDHALGVLLHLILIVNGRKIIANRIPLRRVIHRVIVIQLLLLVIVQLLKTLLHLKVRIKAQQFLAKLCNHVLFLREHLIK
jgi:hypothetical protein